MGLCKSVMGNGEWGMVNGEYPLAFLTYSKFRA